MPDKSTHKDQEPLKEGEDYYFNKSGLMVFTGFYLKKRGYCCKNGCQHCPYRKNNLKEFCK